MIYLIAYKAYFSIFQYILAIKITPKDISLTQSRDKTLHIFVLV